MGDKYFICDIDGVLINTAWTGQTIKTFNMDGKTGIDFFNKAVNCDVSVIDEYCLRYLYFKLSCGLKLMFMTARSEVIEVATVNFIQQKAGLVFGKDFTISTRPAGDELPPHLSKERRLDAMLKNDKKFVLAIDDEELCLDMYKLHGIPALKWQNGMLPVKVVEEYGDQISYLLGKGGIREPCKN